MVYIYACVCMRFHVECVYAITRRCSRACVNTCASTHVCNAVSESSFRVHVNAWRESASRSHLSFRVSFLHRQLYLRCDPHLSLRVPSLHRELYLRCDPRWASSYHWCAAERDNAALTCVPLAQERITAITHYFGPADTCEARARDACACPAS